MIKYSEVQELDLVHIVSIGVQKASFPMAIKPANVTYEEAATICTGGINAIHFLREAGVEKGDHVLINGAGGSIGTYATQLAKLWGAKVTCVDSDIKLDMLKSIGADHVIDYRKENFHSKTDAYNVIIDIVGDIPYSKTLKALKQNGRLFLGNPKTSHLLRTILTNRFNSKKGKVEICGRQHRGLELFGPANV